MNPFEEMKYEAARAFLTSGDDTMIHKFLLWLVQKYPGDLRTVELALANTLTRIRAGAIQ